MTRRSLSQRLLLGGGLLPILLGLSGASPALGLEAVRLALPGRVVEAAVVTPGERPVLALIVEEQVVEQGVAEGEQAEDRASGEEGPRRLFVFDPIAGTLQARGEALPAGTPALVPGGDHADGAWLALARFGVLEVRPVEARPPGKDEGGVTLPLPRRAVRTSWGLELTSPAVQAIPQGAPGATGRSAASPPCFGTVPEAEGRQRLRIERICPEDGTAAAGDGAPPEEIWALLPRPETVTSSRYLELDGAPALAVLTRQKLGIFEEQALRVFSLAESRSREGTRPVFAVETGCPLFRRSEIHQTDADGDGLADLVLVCGTGLMDPEVRIEVYRHRSPGEPGGPFDPRPRDLQIDGEAEDWHYGADWTGDGVPDLLLEKEGLLHLHPGDPRGRRPVESRASRTFALPGRIPDQEGERRREVSVRAGDDDGDGETGEPARPQVSGLLTATDLDGNGRPELVLRKPGEAGDELIVFEP